MNPFFRKPFIIITSLFILIILLIYGVLFHGFVSQWQWQNEDSSVLSSHPYSRYDWQAEFNAPNGLLIKIESDNSQYEVDAYGRLYRQSNPRKHRLYFSDKEGVRFISQAEGSFYNAYCVTEKCLLFTEQGRQTINLADFKLSDVVPWQENNRGYGYHRFPLALIGGQLLFSESTSQLILADNKTITASSDEGESWEYAITTEDLVKQYYAEDFGEFTQFHYAISGDLLHIFYNQHYAINTLAITLNLVNKEVTQTRWLPIRVIDVAQNQQGNIYFIARHASRDLYSIFQYQTNGNLRTIYESGYKYLRALKVSNDHLLFNQGRGDDEITLTFDFKMKALINRQRISDDMMFNPALSRFIRFFDNYGDQETLLLLGERLKYSQSPIN